jgi:predicted ATP-dependent endonuclease of OLD family
VQLEEVRVRGFRNTEDSGWVDVHEDVTTLVGKNESGKTSFLEAIGRLSDTNEIEDDDINNQMRDVDDSFPVVQAKFSESADGVPESVGTDEGIVYKRKDGRLRVSDNLGIDANRVVLLEDSVRHIEDRVGASHSDVREETQISGVDESNLPLRYDNFGGDPNAQDIIDTIDSVVDSTTGSGVEEALSSMREFLDDNEPRVIRVRDVLPGLIYSTDIDTISNSCGRRSLTEEENAPFRRLLTLGEVDHQNYHKLNKTTQLSQRENAQEEIRERFNSFWNQKSIGVGIQYSEQDDEFLLMVKDTELLDRDSGELRELDRSLTEPSKRSRGFRWFLSFFVDQVTRENGVNGTDDTVYLIDDPAVYLHPEGKKNWLDTIEDLTDDAQFLYSSHSPFLIDETRPDRIRIVEDRPGDRTQVTDEIFQGDSETLEPLRHTLGIGLGDSPFVNRRKILVEGPSDYFILTGVLNYLDEHEPDTPLSTEEVTLYPVGGADEMLNAGEWVHSEEFAFAFLLDNDQKGKNVEDSIENHALLDESRVFFLEHERAKNSFNIEIEDMFHPEFYVDCVNEVYGREEVRETIEVSEGGPDDLSDLESVGVTEAFEEGWLLDGEQEYKGMKIVTKIEDAFAEQGYSDLDLDKVRVAKNVQTRLQNGDGLREEDVSAFKGVLGRMHGALYD